jgi:hypothetical protein
MAFDKTEDGGRDANPWFYEMPQIGYNYRLPDVLCALGISQLAKLDRFAARRRTLESGRPVFDPRPESRKSAALVVDKAS